MRYLYALLITLILCNPLQLQAQISDRKELDSMENALPHLADDTGKIKLLYKISFCYSTYDPAKGLTYGNQALQLAEKQDWKKGKALASNALGQNYFEKGDMAKATELAQSSLKTFEELGISKSITANLDFLATIYAQLGDYDKSLEYLFRCLSIAEQIHDDGMQQSCYTNIGATYSDMKQPGKALDYLFKGLALSEKQKQKYSISLGLLNISSAYLLMGDYTKALEYSKRGLKVSEEIDNSKNIETALNNLTSIYKELNDYGKSLDCGYKALDMLAKDSDMAARGPLLLQLGETYTRIAIKGPGTAAGNKYLAGDSLQNLEKAINLLKESAKETENTYIAVYIEAQKALAIAYAATGNYKSAYESNVIGSKLDDSIFTADRKVALAQGETKHEADLRLQQEAINEEQQLRGRILVVALGLGGVIILIIIVAYRRAVKREQVLAEQKRELSEQRKIIDTQVEQLESAAAVKTRFLANISHELRTPLTLLTGMLELVNDNIAHDQPVDADKIKLAFNNSRKLHGMVEEILDLSRVENKTTEINTTVTEAAPLLKNIVSAFEPYCNKQGITLTYDDIKTRGAYIAVDEDKFEKIINNLVYNAIKFNKKGGSIKVDAGLSIGADMVTIAVSDTGVGIDNAELQHIFDRFYKGTTTNKAAAEGVGIGLSLVKEFTELMGGKVSVSSKVGEGTIFTLHFPAKAAPASQQQPEEEEIPQINWDKFARKNTVLLAEDNADMRYYVREVFGNAVNIAEAGNGKEALAWMQDNTPDLIITDMMMPEMDGKELVANIKANGAYNKIPVITLTALADMSTQLSMLRLGVDDYIVKPFNAYELRIRAYNLLNNFIERQEFNSQPAEPDEPAPTDAEADLFRDKVKEYVLSNIKYENISVIDLAGEMLMSERQLYRMSKGLTGYTPAQLVKEIRLQRAYELLLSGDIAKLEDVAKRVGFENPNYFSRQFLERFGKRPTEFL